VYDLNRACFKHDKDGVARHGTQALNVTGVYFSDDIVASGLRHYEDWAERDLAERSRQKSELTLHTHRAVFHGRVGACTEVRTKNKTYTGVINAIGIHYRKEKAFTASFRLEVL
jgi:HD superfamily phosphohydrolase YqeK